MEPIDVGGHKYTVGKLDVFTQANIARKVAPMFAQVMAAKAATGSVFVALAESLSHMTDDDFDFVMRSCMKVARRLDGEKFLPVMAGNGSLMYQDIELPDVLQLTTAALQENLGRFFDKSVSAAAG